MEKTSFLKKYYGGIILVLIGLVLYYFISQALIDNYRNRQEAYFSAEMNAFESKVNATLSTYEAFSEYLFQHNFNNAYISGLMVRANQGDEVLRQQLRDELYAFFANDYEMFTQYNFRQLHFHLANGDSFLRFHRPELFGDNLVPYRESIRLVGSEQRYIFGFEEGRIYNGYRFVYPLFHQDVYVGSVEVSISMATIAQIFKDIYPEIYTSFVISQEVVDRLVFEDELSNYVAHPYLTGYYSDVDVLNAVNQSCVSLLEPCIVFEELMRSEPNLLDSKENVSRIVHFQGQDYLVQFLLIRNITYEPVAYFIGITVEDSVFSFFDLVGRDILLIGALFLLLFISTFIYQTKRHQLEVLSSTDKLTNLANRRQVLAIAEREVLRYKRYKTPLSFIIADIDLFKRINDTYGHRKGDEILIRFGEILKEGVRNLDVVSRYGGEEFLLLLVDTDLKAAIEIAERLRHTVEAAEFPISEKITSSFGIATIEGDESLDEVIDRSDRALYQAKAEGRNLVRY